MPEALKPTTSDIVPTGTLCVAVTPLMVVVIPVVLSTTIPFELMIGAEAEIPFVALVMVLTTLVKVFVFTAVVVATTPFTVEVMVFTGLSITLLVAPDNIVLMG